MRILSRSVKLSVKRFSLICCLASIYIADVAAAPPTPNNFSIKNIPLFMGVSITPNFYILLDDSESMDAEIMAQPHWARAAYDKTAVDIPTLTDEYFTSPTAKNACAPSECNIQPLATDQRVCCCNADMNCAIEKNYSGYINISLSDTDRLAYTNVNRVLGAPNQVYKGSVFKTSLLKYPPFGFISYCRVGARGKGAVYQNCENRWERADNIDTFGCFFSPSSAFSVASCPATENLDWRLRSADVNTIFYNPRETYTPWYGYADANFSAVLSNPYNFVTNNMSLMPGYNIQKNLGRDPNIGRDPTSCVYDANGNITCNTEGFVYYIWNDDKGFNQSDNHPRRGANVNITNTPNGEVDLWDSHYKVTVTNNNIEVQPISCNVDTTGNLNCCTPAGGGGPPCPSAVRGKDLGALLRSLNAPFMIDRCAGEPSCDPFVEEKKNIANWYQYARRRSMLMKQAVVKFILKNPSYRYAMDTFDNALQNKTNPMPLIPFPADNNRPIIEDISKLNEHSNKVAQEVYKLFDPNRYYDQPGPSTPARIALDKAGKYYSNKSSNPPAIVHECQRNFTILISDGWWDNEDSYGAKTLADIAKDYYENDLRSDLPDVQPPLKEDPKRTQHMVTYTIGLGVEGKLKDQNPRDGWPDTIVTDPNNIWGNQCDRQCWGDPTTQTCASGTVCPEKIDDLWHTAYNSHGRYYSAKSVTDLIQQLTAIGDLTAPDFSTGAASGFSQRFIGAEFTSFVPGFTKKGNDWVGFLKSYDKDSNLIWEASVQLNSMDYDKREILTFDPQQREGIAFRWKDLTNAQKSALDMAWTGGVLTPDGKGEQRVDFLRGKGLLNTSDKAWANSNNFRVRSSRLGDIVYSDPVYVGKPIFRYDESPDATFAKSYAEFKENNDESNERSPIIYVGANDGMLHGFNAEDGMKGQEVMAYAPNILFPNLTQLTSLDYNHLYYVDGPITVGDAFISNKWSTLLIGSLRAGGQGYYALDITEPGRFKESNADKIVKWEFTDNPANSYGDRDLGYTFGKALIIRTNSMRWVAIFGNGYNNTVNDAYPSQTGNAVLYIVDAETGKLIKKIDTGVGYTDARATNHPNGLATPTAIDVDGDFKADYIYAGDLLGNLWKFDISNANEGSWGIANGAPLFKAQNDQGQPQPITTDPFVYKNIAGGKGYLVYFGTGKFFEQTDAMAVDQPTQSFYAIWDKDPRAGSPNITRSNLFQQEFISQFNANGIQYRKTKPGNVNWQTQFGWYLDFIMAGDNQGEKQVSDITFNNNTVIFSTTLPQSQQNTCEFGGASWLYFLNAADGGPPTYLKLDMNGDRKWSANEINDPPSALSQGERLGIISTPSVYKESSDIQHIYACGTTGKCVDILTSVVNAEGRQTWRQLYNFPTQ